MNRDAQIRGYERMRKLKIPERFKYYRVMLAEMPDHPECDLVYDMPRRTIWINATAQPGANVVCVEMDR